MTKVMVFGTFDLLHPGHVHMLKEAKEYGDKLIAVIARDKNVTKIKGMPPLRNENERVKNLKKLNIADTVRLGYINDKYQVIREEQPDIIALGFDQKTYVDKLAENLDDHVQIVRLAPFKPEKYKSSKLSDEQI